MLIAISAWKPEHWFHQTMSSLKHFKESTCFKSKANVISIARKRQQLVALLANERLSTVTVIFFIKFAGTIQSDYVVELDTATHYLKMLHLQLSQTSIKLYKKQKGFFSDLTAEIALAYKIHARVRWYGK